MIIFILLSIYIQIIYQNTYFMIVLIDFIFVLIHIIFVLTAVINALLNHFQLLWLLLIISYLQIIAELDIEEIGIGCYLGIQEIGKYFLIGRNLIYVFRFQFQNFNMQIEASNFEFLLFLIISLNMHFDEILLLYMIKAQIIKFSQYSLIYQLSHAHNYRYYDSIIKYFLNQLSKVHFSSFFIIEISIKQQNRLTFCVHWN